MSEVSGTPAGAGNINPGVQVEYTDSMGRDVGNRIVVAQPNVDGGTPAMRASGDVAPANAGYSNVGNATEAGPVVGGGSANTPYQYPVDAMKPISNKPKR